MDNDIRTGYDRWIGIDAVDRNGERLGEISDIYYDDVTNRPEWVAIKAGLFKGTRIAPLAGARLEQPEGADDDDDGRLVLNVDKDAVDQAPHDFDDDDGHLTPMVEQDLYRHFGFDWNRRDQDFGYGQAWEQNRFDKDYTKRREGAIGNVGTERGTVAAEATVKNQEARVVEGTETVRLRKYQHTEMVPVTKEEVRVERVQDKASRK